MVVWFKQLHSLEVILSTLSLTKSFPAIRKEVRVTWASPLTRKLSIVDIPLLRMHKVVSHVVLTNGLHVPRQKLEKGNAD
jgi:hypothetical protein